MDGNWRTKMAMAPPLAPPLSLWRRLGSAAIAVELFVDLLAIGTMAFQFNGDAKRTLMTVFFVITLAGSIGATAQGFRLQPAVPPAIRPTRRQILWVLFGGTLGSLVVLTGLILLWIPILPFAAIWGILWVIVVVSFIADLIATINILR